ncbi:MAG: hypothetical protein GY937_27370 [bacterium]|nr:hypothetical protein [bacterium]
MKADSRIRVRLWCDRRFAEITTQLAERVAHGEMTPRQYWHVFWHHRLAQLHHWLDGSIDDRVYYGWLFALQHQFTDDDRVGGMGFREAGPRPSRESSTPSSSI